MPGFNTEFYEWLKSCDYLSTYEKDELSCIMGIAVQYKLDDKWFKRNKVSGWLRNKDKEKFLNFVNLEQMMFKMGV